MSVVQDPVRILQVGVGNRGRMWAKIIARRRDVQLVGLVDVWAILTVGSYLFDVPLRGSAALITVSTFLYLFTTLGVGIFISTVSRSQQQAILGGFFFQLCQC